MKQKIVYIISCLFLQCFFNIAIAESEEISNYRCVEELDCFEDIEISDIGDSILNNDLSNRNSDIIGIHFSRNFLKFSNNVNSDGSSLSLNSKMIEKISNAYWMCGVNVESYGRFFSIALEARTNIFGAIEYLEDSRLGFISHFPENLKLTSATAVATNDKVITIPTGIIASVIDISAFLGICFDEFSMLHFGVSAKYSRVSAERSNNSSLVEKNGDLEKKTSIYSLTEWNEASIASLAYSFETSGLSASYGRVGLSARINAYNFPGFLGFKCFASYFPGSINRSYLTRSMYIGIPAKFSEGGDPAKEGISYVSYTNCTQTATYNVSSFESGIGIRIIDSMSYTMLIEFIYSFIKGSYYGQGKNINDNIYINSIMDNKDDTTTFSDPMISAHTSFAGSKANTRDGRPFASYEELSSQREDIIRSDLNFRIDSFDVHLVIGYSC